VPSDSPLTLSFFVATIFVQPVNFAASVATRRASTAAKCAI